MAYLRASPRNQYYTFMCNFFLYSSTEFFWLQVSMFIYSSSSCQSKYAANPLDFLLSSVFPECRKAQKHMACWNCGPGQSTTPGPCFKFNFDISSPPPRPSALNERTSMNMMEHGRPRGCPHQRPLQKWTLLCQAVSIIPLPYTYYYILLYFYNLYVHALSWDPCGLLRI